MSARLRFTPEAVAELREASAWHEGQREGLGEAFVDAIFGALERVCATPEAFSLYPPAPGVRRALVQRFNFAIYYRPSPGDVLVAAVLHQRRNPKALTSRLRKAPKPLAHSPMTLAAFSLQRQAYLARRTRASTNSVGGQSAHV